jgi:hypothetical protein
MEKIVRSSNGNAAFQAVWGWKRELVFPGVTPPSRRQGGFQPPLSRVLGIDFPGAWAGSPLAGKDAGVTPAFTLLASSRQIKAHTEELLMLTKSDLPRSVYCLLVPAS